MTQEGQLPPPPVIWAQRRDVLFVTFCLEDCVNPEVKIESEKIYFKGIGGTEHKMHEVTINLYKDIVPDKTEQKLRGRNLELILTKTEAGPYWPRLLKENVKAHWLKCDFNKWKDEDDSDDEDGMNMPGSNDSLQELMKQMSGLGGTGDSKPNFDDLDGSGDEAEDVDSDDDDMPDLFA